MSTGNRIPQWFLAVPLAAAPAHDPRDHLVRALIILSTALIFVLWDRKPWLRRAE